MARRRQEVALQVEIETQEEWNEIVNKEGLTVVDVYQQWAGPCKSIEGNFKRIKLETGDQLLKFALAKADTIDTLEKYRGHCEPCFLFYATGVLVDVVVGANAPELQRKIILNLEQEKRILKEGGQRVAHDFSHPGHDDEDGDSELDRHRRVSVTNAIATQQYTLGVIRPDAFADGKEEEILEKITQNGFKVLVREERSLNEHDVRELHRYKMNQEGYEEHIARMISGPSVVLMLQKSEAKDASVDDLRELVNSDELLQATFDCTQSIDNNHQELMLLLPNVAEKPRSSQENLLERTLAVIRPSALKLHKDGIINRIRDSGFDITQTTEVTLTRAQAEEFYSSKKDEPYYEDLIQEMTSGTSLALCLVKKDAVKSFHSVLGPAEKSQIKDATGTIRNEFDVPNVKVNSVHGPSTYAEANRNLQFIFPEERIIAILKPHLNDQQRSEVEEAFKKAGFFILARKVEKLSDEQAALLQRSHQGKDYYNDLISYITSGPSEVLLLTKEKASQAWQEVVGSEEPAKASETEPTSIRAIYGQDFIHNAVDICVDATQSKKDIQLIFTDFDEE